MGKIKVQNWSNVAMDREGQKRIIEQHTTHTVVVPREGKTESTLKHKHLHNILLKCSITR
jgi:hypothetical protein